MSDSSGASWTVAHQALLSTEFAGQGSWSGLLCPSPGDFLDPGIEPGSPALQGDSFFPLSHQRSQAIELLPVTGSYGQYSVGSMQSPPDGAVPVYST